MFTGYVGVASAHRPNSYSITLNARGVNKGIENYFEIMGKIYIGQNEIGFATRDLVDKCATYDCMVENIQTLKTVVPMFFIMAGPGENQGTVITKGYDHADNI